MTPRRDRYGEPIDDDEGRHCWRCGQDVDDDRPVPVCDTCANATNDRVKARERRNNGTRRGRADVRPREPDALRRRAYQAAVEQGLLTPRPKVRRWWEEKTR
jgi:hypothetical protein